MQINYYYYYYYYVLIILVRYLWRENAETNLHWIAALKWNIVQRKTWRCIRYSVGAQPNVRNTERKLAHCQLKGAENAGQEKAGQENDGQRQNERHGE